MRIVFRTLAFCLLASVLFLTSCGKAETEVKGTVKGEVIVEPGRYVIKDVLHIESGASFVVPAGSEVRLAQGSTIIVEGSFAIRALASKRVSFKVENSKGFKVGTGFSDTRLMVNNASILLENCDFKGEWAEPLVRARAATVRILKSTFTSGNKPVLDCDGAGQVDFVANRFSNRDMVTNTVRVQSSGSVNFSECVFDNCSLAENAVILDGNGSCMFKGNHFRNCEFSGAQTFVVGRFYDVTFIENELRALNLVTAGGTGFMVEAMDSITLMRNEFARVAGVGASSTALRFRSMRAQLNGNNFIDNTAVTLITAASNNIAINADRYYRNEKSPVLLAFYGRKGEMPSNLEILNCRFRKNTPATYFDVRAFGNATIHKNIFEGGDLDDTAATFVNAMGNTDFSLHANKFSKIVWPKLLNVDLQTELIAEWADNGNLIPYTNIVSIGVTQNEFDKSIVSLTSTRPEGETPALSWNVMTNIFTKSDLSNLLPEATGQVGAVVRFNKFMRCDEVKITQSGGGAKTEIDRNVFNGLKVLTLNSKVTNPIVEFRMISNSFESSSDGIIVRIAGEVYHTGNYYQNAVIWE